MQTPKKTAAIRDALRSKAGSSVAPATTVVVDARAISEGRKPLASRRNDTAAIEAQARALYGVPAAGLDAIPPIESGFKFAALKSDEEFHFLQVEPLLQQAAALLDACGAARTERDQLQVEKWKLQMELDQFFRLDQIRQRERQAGADTEPYERAMLEAGAEKSLEENHKNAESQLKTLLDDLLASGFNKRMAARELAAWLASYPLKDQDLRGDDAVYTFDGARKTKPEHLYDAARIETDEAAWEQFFSLMARRQELAAASDAARLRKESLELLAKWCLADIAFRGEKEQAARDAMWEKVYQVQSPHGVMNYSDRIAPIESSFQTDFREGLARTAAVRRGLKDLFGYSPAFPQEASAGYFDQTVAWVRRASQRVAQFTALDQCYVLALSLKELAKDRWEQGLASSNWTFDVADDLFPGQAHVRLRGLALAVVGGPSAELAADPKSSRKGAAVEEPKATGFWTASVSAPPRAAIQHLSGERVELDQSFVPICFFGRVTDRDASFPPEIAGANILHNASPIGKQWKLALSTKSTDGVPSANLRDIQLYLHLAVRSKTRS